MSQDAEPAPTAARPRKPAALDGLKRWVKRRLVPDAYMVRRQYRYRNGFLPDLADPRALSEKVLWLKLKDRSPLHTICADKIAARDYVTMRCGPDLLAPVYLTTRDPEAFRPEAIAAETFVAKTNHDQGGVFICADRAAFDWDGARADMAARMKQNKYYEFRERQYRDIRPGIIVEALIGDGGEGPPEIKVNCCNGAPRFIQMILGRFGDRRQAFYGPDWVRLPMRGRATPIEGDRPRPPQLDRVLEAAAVLAEPFPFCRVDFLVGSDGTPWFNEITFHPAAGLVRYQPEEMEFALGAMVDLSRLAEARRLQDKLYRDLRRCLT